MKKDKPQYHEEDLPEGMQHGDFSIGCEFTCGGKRWRCTDVGTRVIVAICLEPAERVRSRVGEDGERREERDISEDSSWFNGPPYAVVEHVFDENDFGSCTLLSPAKRHEAFPQESGEQERRKTRHIRFSLTSTPTERNRKQT